MPTIPADLSALLVLFAGIVSHFLRSDQLPPRINVLIAALACLIASAVTFWLVGGLEQTGSTREAVTAFIVFTGWMTGKELLALLNYLQEATSPLVPDTSTKPIPSVRRTTRPDQY